MKYPPCKILIPVAAIALAVLIGTDRGTRAGVHNGATLSADSFEAVFGPQDPVDRSRPRPPSRPRDRTSGSKGADGFTILLAPPPLSPFQP